jgi:hypothetical protein
MFNLNDKSYNLSKISGDLDVIKEKQLKEFNEQETERLKELIDVNAITIQEHYDFNLMVIYPLETIYIKITNFSSFSS